MENQTEKLRILFIGANYSHDMVLRIPNEYQRIKEAIKAGKLRDMILLEENPAARRHDLSNYISEFRPMIIHFSGHGTGETGPLFEDDIETPDRLKDTLSVLRMYSYNLKLVFFNVCDSRLIAEETVKFIEMAIAAPHGVDDDGAIKAAESFYRSLANGDTIDICFSNAQRGFEASGGSSEYSYSLLPPGKDEKSHRNCQELFDVCTPLKKNAQVKDIKSSSYLDEFFLKVEKALSEREMKRPELEGEAYEVVESTRELIQNILTVGYESAMNGIRDLARLRKEIAGYARELIIGLREKILNRSDVESLLMQVAGYCIEVAELARVLINGCEPDVLSRVFVVNTLQVLARCRKEPAEFLKVIMENNGILGNDNVGKLIEETTKTVSIMQQNHPTKLDIESIYTEFRRWKGELLPPEKYKILSKDDVDSFFCCIIPETFGDNLIDFTPQETELSQMETYFRSLEIFPNAQTIADPEHLEYSNSLGDKLELNPDGKLFLHLTIGDTLTRSVALLNKIEERPIWYMDWLSLNGRRNIDSGHAKYGLPIDAIRSGNLEDILKAICFVFNPKCKISLVSRPTDTFFLLLIIPRMIIAGRRRYLEYGDHHPSFREYIGRRPDFEFKTSFKFDDIGTIMDSIKKRIKASFRNPSDTHYSYL